MKHLSPWWNERGATATTTEMVPRQHSDDPTTHLDTGAKEQVCGCAEHAKDGGVIPVTGFPRVNGMETSDKSDTVQTRASHTTHAFGPRLIFSGLYL